MSALNIIRIASRIIPIIAEVVDSVEAVHSGKDGAKKKEIALKTTEILYNHTAPVVPFSDIVKAVSDLIDSTVTTKNEEGEFYKDVHKEPAA